MKYCTKCGAECNDKDVFCSKCSAKLSITSIKRDSTVDSVISILVILCDICLGLTIIGLAWAIPMTIAINKRIKNNKKFGVGLSVCTLLFISKIAGILMLLQDNQ